MRLRFTVLGPVAVVAGEQRSSPSRAQTRGVLGLLLLNAGRAISLDAIVEAMWAGAPPPKARSQVHSLIWAVRRHLGRLGPEQPLVTAPAGYRLSVEPELIDVCAFEDLRRTGAEAVAGGDFARCAGSLRAALDLWLGRPLADACGAFVEPARARLVELRLSTLEGLADALLALGRPGEVLAELAAAADEFPLREPVRLRLMQALYRSGNAAGALQTYRAYKSRLAEDLGLDPGAEIAELELAVIRGAPAHAPEPTPRERPSAAVPAQLPAGVPDFVGRAAELSRLDGFAGDGGTAVITAIAGAAGVGKTAFAVHWSQAARTRFPDGQLYLDLRGYAEVPPMPAPDALGWLLRGLGVPNERIPPDPEEASALLRTVLADRRVLLILDNARDAAHVRPLLPGSGASFTIVTSRDRLSGLVAREGARRLTLDVLTPAESLLLLQRVLGRDRVAAEPDAAAALTGFCGHLPLALRITATDLADHPDRRVAEHLADLHETAGLTRLELDGDRRSSVRAVFDLTYAAFDAPAQRMFRLLGLLPGADFTAESAAALTLEPEPVAARLLDGLTTAHFLQRARSGRYTLHDLLRRYARDLLRDEVPPEQAAATRRLLDHFLYRVDAAARLVYPQVVRLPLPPNGSVTPAFTDRKSALGWLEAEVSNVVAAVHLAREQGEATSAWLLADALRGFFWISRRMAEWLAASQAGLAAAAEQRDVRAQAAARLSLGIAYRSLQQHDSASEHLEHALALSRECAWPEAEASVLGSLAIASAEQGRTSDAVGQLTQALGVNRRLGRRAGEAVVLGNLGTLRFELGQLRAAVDDCTAAAALYRETGSASGEAVVLSTRGLAHMALGKATRAKDDLTRGLALHDEVGDRYGRPFALAGLGTLHSLAGRTDLAYQHALAAREIARESGEHRGELAAIIVLGHAAMAAGALDEAGEHYTEALVIAEKHRDTYHRCEALVQLGEACLRAGDSNAARSHAASAYQLAAEPGYSGLLARAQTLLAGAALAGVALAGVLVGAGVVVGRVTGGAGGGGAHAREAVRLATAAAKQHRRNADCLGEIDALAVLALACEALGDKGSAALHRRRARTLRRRSALG